MAQMSVAEVEAITLMFGWSPDANVGPGKTLHCVPFHWLMTCPGMPALVLTLPAAQASVGEMSTTPARLLKVSPVFVAGWKAVHLVPSKWMVDSPTAHMSLGEDADAAASPLLKFSLGVGIALKIEVAPACARAGRCWRHRRCARSPAPSPW